MKTPLLRGDHAPPPRTLLDIVRASIEAHPDATAIDNGQASLTYAELADAAEAVVESLRAAGVARGMRVGVRVPSGTLDLYVAIIGVLAAGAAYVPVDFDDPDERAHTVFTEAQVAAVITTDLVIRAHAAGAHAAGGHAAGAHAAYAKYSGGGAPQDDAVDDVTVDDDAWIIFTSGSTGTPKGVAVTHRNAAAFVDAEARMFLQDRPIRPGDRVMAGLSVAFDASCEEMWLAWRHGACLVPAPRSLVRSGVELGPWLVANRITIVSTVPTLVALWPTEALAQVRLLILGGEACPPEIGARLATDSREVWNTYGPTEATVVACGAQLSGEPPVRIGLPLDGWNLAVVDAQGQPVAEGEVGELIIGGVGLARYLDPDKDAAAYAAMPTLGWSRAYRSGDLVRADPEGLVFVGRADDQIKLGGRRIELGEVDSALLALPGVAGGAAAVRTSEAGNRLLVGYVSVEDGFERQAATEQLRRVMPAALVPRLVVVDSLPTRTSGKIDRDALPWPVGAQSAGRSESSGGSGKPGGFGGPRGSGGPGGSDGASADPARLDVTDWVSGLWASILGGLPLAPDENFFDVGGGSLSAAQLVSRLRERFPDVTVADLYVNPSLGELVAALHEMDTPAGALNRDVPPVPRKTQRAQALATIALRMLSGVRWVVWVGIGNAAVNHLAGLTQFADLTQGDNLNQGAVPWLPTVPWWLLLIGWVLFISPPGRMALSVLGARALLHDLTPGEYPRGGEVHLRIWLAERLADELGATNLAGAAFIKIYARALGATIANDVDLHTIPPVTGMLRIGPGAAIEPEVDLRGHWIDGSTLIVGPIRVRAGARVGARSTLLPGADIGARSEVAPGSAVFGGVPADQTWSGAPAAATGASRGPWHDATPTKAPRWIAAYAASAIGISLLPIIAIVVACSLAAPAVMQADTLGGALGIALLWVPVGATVGMLTLALLVLAAARVLSAGLHAGLHPVHGRQAWQAWSILRLLDEARTWLFPIYSSSITPVWLRALGADVGRDVEASTVLLLPSFTKIGAGAFLADDTLVASYELGGGWMRVERVRIGKGAFVGNSGMAAPGRKVPRESLVAVLSAAPRKGKAKAGSSWLGSPPQPLRRVGVDDAVDSSRTTAPTTRLRCARALVEAARAVPVWLHAALCIGVVAAIEWLLQHSLALAIVTSGIALVVAGAVAAIVATGAKWALVGRLRPGDKPLWSSFVWRNELADTFIEVLAAAWFARAVTGTMVLNVWLRSMGAQIGHGVWCETYWLPEADLITLNDGATINAGTVVQTHLFHDRVLSMDTVVIRRGGTLGTNSVILPAATIGRHATVGPASLVMRGESIPDRTRWIGNPVGPWIEDENSVSEQATREGREPKGPRESKGEVSAP